MIDKLRGQPSDADQQKTLLARLLNVCGIQQSFVNFAGETEYIAEQDLLAVLAAQHREVRNSHQAPDPALIRTQLDRLQRETVQRLLPPVAVFTKHIGAADGTIEMSIPGRYLRGMLHGFITREDGQRIELNTVGAHNLTEAGQLTCNGDLYSKRSLSLPLLSLTTGYHQLTVTITAAEHNPGTVADSISQSIPLVVAPARIYEPQWSSQARKIWGFSVQLYSFCTQRSWGMGDFADLHNLISTAARQGADYLILNPLHAGALDRPEQCSPYSPVDRRRLNPLYIAPELEPEFYQGRAHNWFGQNQTALNLRARVSNQEWIDYAGTSELKLRVLAMMYEDFSDSDNCDRKQAFEDFKKTASHGLPDYAHWQAGLGCAAAGKFSASPDFYMFLQWLAEKQLSACQQHAANSGMAIGLIRDLAVGSDRNGAEVCLSHGVFAQSASIGAPPDPLAPQGQNWGLPPLDPSALRNLAYAPFIDLLRSNMSSCGALRIDHVMSLMRLWWCPYEKSGNGAYVKYPAEDLFAILRLESERAQCLVIGEDLGIVPEQVRQLLNESAVYSNLLFYFEKENADNFRSPQHYNHRALAMLANHDVPTLAAWWDGSDLILRRNLNLIADETQYNSLAERRRTEKKQILQLLESQWLLPANRFGADQLEIAMDSQLTAALMRLISRSNAMMVSVQLEDLIQLRLPVNIPGTSAEYRNWQRKMPPDLLEYLDSDTVNIMLEALRVERP